MVRLVNKCSEYYAYEVPSESRKATYEVWISRHDGWTVCTCLDSQTRSKGDSFFNLLNGNSISYCKHMAWFFRLIRRQFQKEQETLKL